MYTALLVCLNFELICLKGNYEYLFLFVQIVCCSWVRLLTIFVLTERVFFSVCFSCFAPKFVSNVSFDARLRMRERHPPVQASRLTVGRYGGATFAKGKPVTLFARPVAHK